MLVGAGAAVALGACQLVAGLERPTETDAPAPGPEAGADAPDALPAGPSFLCREGFPGPIGEDDGAGARYIVAIRGFSFGVSGGRIPAVNLDCVDTRCDAGAVAACTTKTPRSACDESDGGDNQVARLLGNNPFVSIDEQIGRAGIDLGEFGEIIQITNYNGLENDPLVNVGLVPSPGFDRVEQTCEPGPTDAGAPDAQPPDAGFPRWDGCDRWFQSSDFTFPESPVARDTVPGYVRDSVLYVEPQEGARYGIQLQGSVTSIATPGLVARLERTDMQGNPVGPARPALRLNLRNGIVFGRVASSAVLDFVSRFRTGTARQCVDQSTFVFARDTICGAQDLPLTPGSMGKACDAFSIAAAFEATPALPGGGAPTRQNEPCLRGFDGSVADSGLLACP